MQIAYVSPRYSFSPNGLTFCLMLFYLPNSIPDTFSIRIRAVLLPSFMKKINAYSAILTMGNVHLAPVLTDFQTCLMWSEIISVFIFWLYVLCIQAASQSFDQPFLGGNLWHTKHFNKTDFICNNRIELY